ncbi:uncharacterized protein [Nicotiana sylvestris]|uniref:uncharacterized protein n=1 Tax=Nicotiana sylvestris TaxID=4096 RepID=UPI00388CD71B
MGKVRTQIENNSTNTRFYPRNKLFLPPFNFNFLFQFFTSLHLFELRIPQFYSVREILFQIFDYLNNNHGAHLQDDKSLVVKCMIRNQVDSDFKDTFSQIGVVSIDWNHQDEFKT